MADISVTASSILTGSDAVTAQGVAGAAITAGQTLYIDTANSTTSLQINIVNSGVAN